MFTPMFFVQALNFFHFIVIYAARPFISILADDIGAGNVEIGLIASAYSFVQVFLSIPVGKLVDKYGTRLPGVFGSVLLIIGVIGMIFAANWHMVLVFSILIGIAHNIVLVGLQTAITGLAKGSRQNHHVGMMAFITSAAGLIGPVLGGFAQDIFGLAESFWVFAVISGIALVFSLAAPQNLPESKVAPTAQKGALFKNKLVMKSILISGTVFFVMEVVTIYFPLYGKEIGLSSVAIGAVLSARGLTQMAVRPFLGFISKHIGRTPLLICCLLLGGLSIIAYGFTKEYYLLLTIGAFSGIVLGLVLPLTIIMVSDIAPPGQRGQVLALRIMWNYIAQSISPVIFGFLAIRMGLAPVFIVSGSILICCSAFIKSLLAGMPPLKEDNTS